MTCCELMVRVKKSDAQLLYMYCYQMKRSVRRIAMEALAAALNKYWTTERGGAFTAAVVRKALRYLCELKLLEMKTLNARQGTYSLRVKEALDDAGYLDPFFSCPSRVQNENENENECENDYDNEKDNENVVEPGLNSAAPESDADARPAISTENEQRNSPQNGVPSRARAFINKLTSNKINKSTKETVTSEEEKGRSGALKPIEEALAQVDLGSAECKKLRARLVKHIYCTNLRRDLVDRLVAGAALGYISCDAFLRDMELKKKYMEAGKGNNDELWKPVGRAVMSAFKAQGYEFTPTSGELEPAPKPTSEKKALPFDPDNEEAVEEYLERVERARAKRAEAARQPEREEEQEKTCDFKELAAAFGKTVQGLELPEQCQERRPQF